MGGRQGSPLGVFAVECWGRLRELSLPSRPVGRGEWAAVAALDFRSADVKEGKQAEFLVRRSFPFRLVRRIGVRSRGVANQVANALANVPHRPPVEIRRDWYY